MIPQEVKRLYDQTRREYRRQHLAKRKKEHRKRMQALLAGEECWWCDSPATEWDHLNPEEKSYGISDMGGYSDAKIDAELAKCVPACHGCNVGRRWWP